MPARMMKGGHFEEQEGNKLVARTSASHYHSVVGPWSMVSDGRAGILAIREDGEGTEDSEPDHNFKAGYEVVESGLRALEDSRSQHEIRQG
jgi:hypothetical protein